MDRHAVAMTLAGPDGPFQVAATEHGIVATGWDLDAADFRTDLGERLGGPVRPIGDVPPDDPARRLLDEIRPRLEALLHGMTRDATDIPVDLDDRPDFDRRVLTAVREVGWGTTASYGAIARAVGAPRAARAVGGALRRCPISIVIPCHRIIAADGTLGGYGGDGWLDRDQQRSRKAALLLREGVTVAQRAD